MQMLGVALVRWLCIKYLICWAQVGSGFDYLGYPFQVGTPVCWILRLCWNCFHRGGIIGHDGMFSVRIHSGLDSDPEQLDCSHCAALALAFVDPGEGR